MNNVKKPMDTTWIRKACVTVFILTGSIFSAYSLFAFKVNRYGAYFYQPENQKMLSVGVCILVLGLYIRRWKRL